MGSSLKKNMNSILMLHSKDTKNNDVSAWRIADPETTCFSTIFSRKRSGYLFTSRPSTLILPRHMNIERPCPHWTTFPQDSCCLIGLVTTINGKVNMYPYSRCRILCYLQLVYSISKQARANPLWVVDTKFLNIGNHPLTVSS